MKISKKVISMLTALAMLVSAVGVLAADIVPSDSADTQDVITMDNETVLVKDVDYTLEYKDNVKVGEATIIIHFIGNYSGEKEQTFNIKRKPSTGGGGGGSSYSKPTSTATPIPTTEPTATPAIEPTATPSAKPNEFEHSAYIRGYEDGTFKPDGNITRAETASMLNGVIKADSNSSNITFSDLKDGAWYIDAVQAMTAAGIINGYKNGTFRPDRHITRAEFVAMLMRTKDIQTFDVIPFTDITADLWSADYIYTAYTNGYINGYNDGTFRPDSPITRAEAVKIINSVLDRTDFTNNVNPFSDVLNTHWAYKQILEAAVSHNVELK